MDLRGLALLALVVLISCSICTCYKHFQLRIPNGDNVPHPCQPDYEWPGVGHENRLGGGARNVFGIDFAQNNYAWSESLCRKDSDGDGKTNGEELGDPDCTWTTGRTPTSTSGLSHPGVCDPFDSSRCNGKPDFVECGDLDFSCPAIDEPETFNLTVRYPKMNVPEKETTYMCMTFELPSDQEYHMVANTALIDNEDVMHHILVFGCADGTPGPFNSPVECGMGVDTCTDIIGMWSVGIDGQCFHRNTGFLTGMNGYKTAVLQFHWNNPEIRGDHVDGSGMTFFLTPKLRPYNAGVLMIGQNHLEIAPGKKTHVEVGGCASECSRKVMKQNINVVSVLNHMHYMGAAQITELRRNDEFIRDMARDDVYSYDAPKFHVYNDEAIVVRPGDEMRTTCVFDSSSKTVTTNFGEATSAEMCFSFITFYPKENLNTGKCVSYASIPECDFEDGMVQGCNTSVYWNPASPESQVITAKVLEMCSPMICRQECLDYVRKLKKHPCYRGDIDKRRREFGFYYGKEEDKAGIIYWFASLDSCDMQLAQMIQDSGISSSAVSILTGTLCVLLPVFAHYMA